MNVLQYVMDRRAIRDGRAEFENKTMKDDITSIVFSLRTHTLHYRLPG
jgi:hypothetical protein